jgi:hypothetical protein
MTVDVAAAERFLALHGRLLDRQRFAHHVHGASATPALAALAAYRTDDGGFGNALECDLRTAGAQPIHALAGIEHLEELGATPDAPLLDWLERTAGPDGGVAFVLATASDAPLAPWFQPEADPPASLHMTAALAAPLLRMGVEHPFVDAATAFCWDRLPQLDRGAGYEVSYVIAFLDAVPDRERGDAALRATGADLRPDGTIPVRGGTEGEVLKPLDVAPWPGRPARALFAQPAIEAGLDELELGQREDGGWDFTWLAWNPAVAFEWRGRLTVDALRTLRANGRLS